MRVFLFSKAMGMTNKVVMEKLEEGGYKNITSVQSEFPEDAYHLFDTSKSDVESSLIAQDTKATEDKIKEKEEEEKLAEAKKEEIKTVSPCAHDAKFKCDLGGNCPYEAREGYKPALNCNHAM